MTKPWVLAIGGVDPSGGAGLGADREAIEACGVGFVGIVTANTEQDDRAVVVVGEREGWRWQFEALASASVENPHAVKLGLLPSADAVRSALAVYDQVHFEDPTIPVVLDPVLASSSGFVFLEGAGLEALRGFLRRPLVLTPNLPEALTLLGWPGDRPWDDARRLEAASALLEAGLGGLVLKDGHGTGALIRDLVWERGGEPQFLERRRSQNAQGKTTQRGTGCRFASGLAARLGLGHSLCQAAMEAGEWVGQRIARA